MKSLLDVENLNSVHQVNVTMDHSPQKQCQNVKHDYSMLQIFCLSAKWVTTR